MLVGFGVIGGEVGLVGFDGGFGGRVGLGVVLFGVLMGSGGGVGMDGVVFFCFCLLVVILM